MVKLKKVKNLTPKEVKVPIITSELEKARWQLKKFQAERMTAATPDKLKETDFWIVHYTNKIAELSK